MSAEVASFHLIDPGFKTKDAETAFTAYEAVKSELVFDGRRRTTTIHTNGIGFNYVEFIIELNETPKHKMADGGMSVFAEVQTLDRELLVRKRRMVFAPDTEPLAKLKGLQRCDLSLPRSRSGRVIAELVRLMKGWRWDGSATGGLTPTEHRHRCGPD